MEKRFRISMIFEKYPTPLSPPPRARGGKSRDSGRGGVQQKIVSICSRFPIRTPL